MLTLRKTNAADAEFWQRLGKTLPRSGEAFVIEDGGKRLGVLHYTLLWEELPFLNLLLLCGDMQGKGYGKSALAAWETMLRAAGHKTALLSTRADEKGANLFRAVRLYRMRFAEHVWLCRPAGSGGIVLL